jgi:dinuclear metal center YbgI/SA1388 family protein
VTSATLPAIAAYVDALLRIPATPDYRPALNGVQVEHRGPVVKIAAAVDCSARTIRGAVDSGANLLFVHHGLFWGGLQPLTGSLLARVRMLLDHDVALYSAHLPLDAHERYGNSRLLAGQMGLTPLHGFARHETIDCGVRGDDDIATSELVDRLRTFARIHGGNVVTTPFAADARTRRWAICSGSGANAETIAEAQTLGIDTLITGEGPHWTAVDAEEKGLTIIYAGHYATETLGVQALAQDVAERFDVPWQFVAAPTGL